MLTVARVLPRRFLRDEELDCRKMQLMGLSNFKPNTLPHSLLSQMCTAWIVRWL